jgi:hypothetical protein
MSKPTPAGIIEMQLGFIEDELQKLGSSEAAKSIRYRLGRIRELVGEKKSEPKESMGLKEKFLKKLPLTKVRT